ncbi:MAG: cupin protein [Neobacillus sp.]|jgi:mannose-6-phosphate isomerase-like protein (cupin superfamily)|nr:cupin protein [Neobacillus sp.]
MYFEPKTNSNPYDHAYMIRNQENYQVVGELLEGIKREASTIDLYTRLAKVAPNQKQKNEIFHAMQANQGHLTQFTNLYITLTGSKPVYQIEKVPFYTYQEGLQKAYEAEAVGYHEYLRSYQLTQDPYMQKVFLWALSGEQENASRFRLLNEENAFRITDYGPEPFVININDATKENNTFRTAVWTGRNLQVTLMRINVGEDIGLEIHPNLDQFLRVEQGEGLVQMGDSKDRLNFQEKVYDDYALVIPAGKWHNLTNTGNQPLKLYSIYSPPQHPHGTIHETKAIAMAAEEEHNH